MTSSDQDDFLLQQETSPMPDQADPARTVEASEASPTASQSPEEPQPAPPTLDQARAFLREESVRREPRERKAVFLASKGLSTDQIDELLGEEAESDKQQSVVATTPSTATPAPTNALDTASLSSSPSSVPPIVTYPEFLARPQRPPPLITPTGFLNTLYGSAAAASLIYGGARFVLAPMVEALTDARGQLHESAGTQLAQLITKLEGAVSVIPEGSANAARLSAASAAAETRHDEVASDVSTASTTYSYDDPTEVFHRDIGVQTSIPPSPRLAPIPDASSPASASPPASTVPEISPAQHHADKLAALADAVKSLAEAGAGPTSVMADVQLAINGFRDDVDQLRRPPIAPFGTGFGGTNSGRFSGYVTTTRNEPEDEIRRAKENIRRVKGALLTTRTFPTVR